MRHLLRPTAYRNATCADVLDGMMLAKTEKTLDDLWEKKNHTELMKTSKKNLGGQGEGFFFDLNLAFKLRALLVCYPS